MAVACSLLVWAGDFRPPNLPPVLRADNYLLRETHKDEGVAIALDPYTADKDSVFHVKYREHHFLPVRLIITNDTDQPISLADANIQFITPRREKIEPSTIDDIERRVAHSIQRNDRPPVQLPVPMPTRKQKRLSGGTADEIDYLLFKAKAVEPHSTQSGFLFFDMTGVPQPLAGTHVLFTGIRNANGQELFYFDIPLEKMATDNSAKP